MPPRAPTEFEHGESVGGPAGGFWLAPGAVLLAIGVLGCGLYTLVAFFGGTATAGLVLLGLACGVLGFVVRGRLS